MEFRIGDKVRIKERIGDGNDYPVCFTDSMSNLVRHTFKIRGKYYLTVNDLVEGRNRKFCNGDNSLYLLEGGDYIWHSSMFEPVIEKEDVNYHYGDSIKVLEYSGKIGKVGEAIYFFVNFSTLNTDHEFVCSKIREKCPDFCEIAKNMGAIKNIGIESKYLFPEFPTIKQLVAFVNKINELYSQKPSGESKQILTTQKIKENEIRFQKPKASYIRGNVPTGRTICGRRNKTAIEFGHLSNQARYF